MRAGWKRGGRKGRKQKGVEWEGGRKGKARVGEHVCAKRRKGKRKEEKKENIGEDEHSE